MTTHIEIDKLSYACRLLTANTAVSSFSALECKQALARTSESALPHAFAQEVAQYFEQHFAEDAIVCIRKLSFNLRLLVSDLNTGVLAQHLAKGIAQTVFAQHKDGRSDAIQVFNDQAHYAASFIVHLVVPRAEHDWCFQDFDHYQYLSTQEAIVTLLSDRSTILLPIMRHLKDLQMLDSSVRQIDESHAEWLITCWSEIATGSKVSRFSLEDVEHAISLSTAWSDCVNSFSKRSNTPSAKAFLTIYCHLLASTDSASGADRLTSKSHLAAFVLFSILQHADRIIEVIDGNTNYIDFTEDNTANKLTRLALNSALYHAQNNAGLANDIRQVIISSKASSHASQDTSQAKANAKKNSDRSQLPVKLNNSNGVCWSEMSEYAGLGLLLPCIISMQLSRYYTVPEIYKAIRYLLGESLGDSPRDSKRKSTQQDNEAINEAWLERIFTPKINKDTLENESAHGELEDSGLKKSLLFGLAPQIKQKLNALHGHEQLAGLIMAQFAARLSGLQLSSHEYLFNQFLRVRGSIQITHTVLTIKLSPIALGVVLKMTGYSPYRGRLDWLDCDLFIEVQA